MPARLPAANASVKPSARAVYQLKITLKGSKPPIWRRVQTLGGVTLAQLHDLIEVAMGWDGGHLHEFTMGRTRYGMPDEDDLLGFGMDVVDESRAKLYKVAPAEGSKLTYTYDFGDSWDHAVLVEKLLPQEPDTRYPRCLTGKRACPPEDCGGIWGYEGLLETLQHPESPDYAEMVEWLGDDFDPEAFSAEEVNAAFAEMASGVRKLPDPDGLVLSGPNGLLIGDPGMRRLLSALAPQRKEQPAPAIDLDALGYQFTTPPLLIGGRAMEHYGLREMHTDVNFVVTRADYDALAALHPAQVNGAQGDLSVAVGAFTLWASVMRYDYAALAVDALDHSAYRVASAEKLLLLKCLDIEADPTKMIEALTLAQYIRARQFGAG